jgi:hypothetical protein
VNGIVSVEGGDPRSSLRATVAHRWRPALASRFEGEGYYGDGESSLRLLATGEAGGLEAGGRCGLEWIERWSDASSWTFSRETAILWEVWQGPWGAGGFARLNRREGDRGWNVFARIEHRFEWLRRYRWTGYLALGDRAAFRTAGQVEVGMEISF